MCHFYESFQHYITPLFAESLVIKGATAILRGCGLLQAPSTAITLFSPVLGVTYSHQLPSRDIFSWPDPYFETYSSAVAVCAAKEEHILSLFRHRNNKYNSLQLAETKYFTNHIKCLSSVIWNVLTEKCFSQKSFC